MSEVVVVSPLVREAIQEAKKKNCLKSYLNMVETLKDLPEETLVNGALDYAKRLGDDAANDQLGNAWLQALSLKNEELAYDVQEMIDQKRFENDY